MNSDIEGIKNTARSIADSLAWATDPYLPNIANDVYYSIVSSLDPIPFILVIQKELSTIKDIENRLTIADHLEDRLIRYYKNRCEDESELQQFKKEYKSLLHYIGILDDLKEFIKKLRETCENPDRDVLRIDSLVYHHMLSKHDYQEEFLMYSQASYYFARINTTDKKDGNTIPVYVNLFEDRIVVDSAVEFCRSLLGTEHFRLKVLKGNTAPSISVKTFPVKLRNYCFYRYIHLRGEEELKLLGENNERDVEATIVDGEIALLKKEVQNYKEAKERNEDREILHMTEYFIRFLRRDLGWDNDEEEIDPHSEEYNITNRKDEINKRIKYVYSRKGLIKHKADGGVIMKLLVEMGECTDTDYNAVATLINKACGKPVTTSSALMQSHAMSDISGTRKEGWKMRMHTRQSANMLLHYNDIADAFEK